MELFSVSLKCSHQSNVMENEWEIILILLNSEISSRLYLTDKMVQMHLTEKTQHDDLFSLEIWLTAETLLL